MKTAMSPRTHARRSDRIDRSDSRAGRNAAGLAPPAYGVDFVDRELMDAAPVQKRAFLPKRRAATPSARPENKTGLPDRLKAGIERLSGLSMDDVKVHYNSPEPARLQALAYTQGTDIHLGPGQQKQLAHEAWHVVQQKQGRVAPTMQAKGASISDDAALEREADVMGAKADMHQGSKSIGSGPTHSSGGDVVQLKKHNNHILSHIYEHNESPLRTVTSFIARHTGHGFDDVLDSYKDKAFPKLYREEMTSAKADYKPVSVKAYIDEVTGSKGRRSDPMQTGIGKLGYFEDTIRGRETPEDGYDGGHLLGYGWFKHWRNISDATNMAPQLRKENRARYGYKGAWGAEESLSRDAAELLPMQVTASVNYATTSYTASLDWLVESLLVNGDVRDTARAMWTKRARFITINTRVPSQYALHYTPTGWNRLLGEEKLGEITNPNADKSLLNSVRFRTLFYPFQDLWMRLGDFWTEKGRQYHSKRGGGVVSKNLDRFVADILWEIAQGAAAVAVCLAATYGLTVPNVLSLVAVFLQGHEYFVLDAVAKLLAGAGIATAEAGEALLSPWLAVALLVNLYLGQGSIVSALQLIVAKVVDWDPKQRLSAGLAYVLNLLEGNLLRPGLTPSGLLSTSKSTITMLTNALFLTGDYIGYGFSSVTGLFGGREKRD